MALLFNAIETFVLARGFAPTYCLGYSGGLDSHVLLHIFAKLSKKYPIKFRAIHINHNLSSNSYSWDKHCENTCYSLQVEFHHFTVDLSNTTDSSLEEAAREKRYAIFSKLISKDDILLTAHHQNDQAETVLLQLFRGAGPKGLSGMPEIKKFGDGYHARPLLNFSREELVEYATREKLVWIDDESNKNVNFSRNFLRHEIIPDLSLRWPTINKVVARVAKHCAEAQEIIESVAKEDLPLVRGSNLKVLSIKKLLNLVVPRQKQVLRLWIEEQNYPLPSSIKLNQILNELFIANEDRFPLITWKNVELRRFRDELYIMEVLASHNSKQIYPWEMSTPLDLPGVGLLRATKKRGLGLRTEIKDVTIRFRQGGEVCRLPGRQCHHSLKKLFQHWNIPPWLRARVPLIYVNDILVGVVGFYLADDILADKDESGWEMELLSCQEKKLEAFLP